MTKAQLDGLDLATLQRRKSEKWHTYASDVLPAWVAEMDFPIAAEIRRNLEQALELWDVGYPVAPRQTGLCEVFADRMSERWDWQIDPHRVEILSEVVQGIYLALEALSQPGQGVIVQPPIYPPFLSAIEETGRRRIENPLLPGEDRWEIDFDGLATAGDSETRILLLCNPHNPSGRVFTRPELEALAEIALRNDLIVVSDEIHADLTFDGRKHIPFAKLAPEIEARTVTLASPSKAFNIAGLRCAVAYFGSAELRKAFNARFPRHIRGGLGMPGLYASIAAWRDSQAWLDEVVPYLQDNRDHLMKALSERFPEIRCHAPQSTYLAWLDCSRLGWNTSPYTHFLEQGKLALSNGAHFGSAYGDFVRLNFATSREILTQIIERMQVAVATPA